MNLIEYRSSVGIFIPNKNLLFHLSTCYRLHENCWSCLEKSLEKCLERLEKCLEMLEKCLEMLEKSFHYCH